MAITRPGAGPLIVAFSLLEAETLVAYAVGYPLEEATDAERKAFKSAIAKVKVSAKRKQVKRTHSAKFQRGK